MASIRAIEESPSPLEQAILGDGAPDRPANASYEIVIEGSSYVENLSPHRREVLTT